MSSYEKACDMAFAPEPYRSACLEVVYMAVLEARLLGWSGERRWFGFSRKRSQQLADLMDAIHNIPYLLKNWDNCDLTWLRDSFIGYDRKWANANTFELTKIFDKKLAEWQTEAIDLPQDDL